MSKFDLSKVPVHLGLGARCETLPPFDGTMAWYERYGREHARDGVEGRLVSLHTFATDWSTWEMHPKGEELVLVVAGKLTLVQIVDAKRVRTELGPGQAAINPRGVWHTAEVREPTTALFITAGEGTDHRTEPPA